MKTGNEIGQDHSTPSGFIRFPRWLVSGLAGYVGLVLMLLMLENLLVYHPTPATTHWLAPPLGAGIEDVTLALPDGTRIHGWWCPKATSDRAILYCHGNAGNLSHRGSSIVKMRELMDASVLIIDYPGYGKSEGSPSEQGCYESADAAYAWLTGEKKFAPKKIILYGASLGGGVITELASRQDHRALVLVKTFTSLPDAAADVYWWLPVPKRLLMRNRFDSLSRIKNCHRPIFVAHGADDTLIGHALGEKLYEAANAPKQFMSLPACGHNDPLPTTFFTELNRFLREHPVD